jgi:hypothetical protein
VGMPESVTMQPFICFGLDWFGAAWSDADIEYRVIDYPNDQRSDATMHQVIYSNSSVGIDDGYVHTKIPPSSSQMTWKPESGQVVGTVI